MGSWYHMRKHKGLTLQYLQFSILLSIFHLLCISPESVTGQQNDGVMITLSDFQALQAFKRELIDLRGALKSWNGSRNAACSGSWAGIKCVKGNVIAIQLPFKVLSGRISNKVAHFKELRRLSLHDNLIGGTIPSAIGSLPNLRGLYLFNNRFSGMIPPSIGNSPQLQAIDLSNNLLTGSIPVNLVASPRIHRLNLSFNSFSGSIPPSVSLSSSLTFLALQNNNFSGSLPSSWATQNLRSLTLDHNSLSGTIPHSLGKLGNLEELSLGHNKFIGTIPDEITSLLKLRALDLSSNSINGSLPKGLVGLKNLSSLNLKKNHLTGDIPSSIGNLSSISLLDLSQNNFTGEIPASLENLSNLTSFNVSYNSLSGQVPIRLSKRFNSSSFVGNIQLCGFGPTPCIAPSPVSEGPSLSPSMSPLSSDESKHHHRRLSTKDIILIIVGVLLAILFLLCCVLLFCLIRKRAGSKASNGKAAGVEKGFAVGTAGASAEAGPNGGKLVLFDGPFVFTADDLLCATAEIMGKSPYGTVYKATLEDGNQVAVKRLREKLAKCPKEFEIEVAALGRIRHQNLLPLRAYYLGPKGEKLLVFDYLSKGSLSSFLHARGPETTIDWPTRMKIAIGVTRGLNHIHSQENLVHGNLTSSDVYLDEQNNPRISDYGIHRLMTDTANTSVIGTGPAGYRAPELPKTKKATTKSDIYSLGVIILELLTGKSPNEPVDGSDLPQWVASTVKEEWTNEVFDLELMRDVSTTGDEMLNTLKLALHLVDPSPDARPDVQQILHQLEEINPKLTTETPEESAEKSHH